jgi:cytochrome c-type biogenesis protein CcmH
MSRKNYILAPVFLTLLATLLLPALGMAELTQTEVSESLICYACPGEPLNVDRCSGGDQMRDVITRMIGEGKSKAEILDYFVTQFGDSILTTVPKKGFNLIAYTGPVIGLLVGLPVVFLVLRRWGLKGREQSAEQSTPEALAALDDEMKQQIEKELSDLDEES